MQRLFSQFIKKNQLTGSRKQWMERHVNDPFVKAAKLRAYRSRAAFKLMEIDDKHSLLSKGMWVVDIGAAPGGWSQVIAERIGSNKLKATCVAVDLLSMPPIEGVNFV